MTPMPSHIRSCLKAKKKKKKEKKKPIWKKKKAAINFDQDWMQDNLLKLFDYLFFERISRPYLGCLRL